MSTRPHRERADAPRERLAILGPEALTDAELISLLLRTGHRARPAHEIARDLLERCDLPGLACLPGPVLRREPGLGVAKAASLCAAFEIGRRVAVRRAGPRTPIRTAGDVHRAVSPRLRDAPREHFCVLLLDGRHRLIRTVTVSLGILTASLVHPREVFAPALEEPAAAIVLVHNHPSGDPSPSQEDREVTRRLVAAGELLGIPVLDHVVVAREGYVSLRDEGVVPCGEPVR